MMEEREQLAEAILNHALEIICLLTVEDFIVVKRPPDGTRSTFSIRATEVNRNICGAPSECPELLFTLLGMGDKTQKMISDLANKIVWLLARKLPAQHEDVVAHFSKDEWKHPEGHRERYKNNQDICMIVSEQRSTEKSYPIKVELDEEPQPAAELPTAPVQRSTEKSYPITCPIKEELDHESQPAADGTSTLTSSGFIPKEKSLSTVNVHRPFMEAETSTGFSFISSCDVKPEPGEDSSDDTEDSEDEESPQFPSSDQEQVYNIIDAIKEEPEENPDSYMPESVDVISTDEDYSPDADNKPSRKRKSRSGQKLSPPCEECGKVFSSKSSLDKHMKTHTGERPFMCNDCGKRFSAKDHLTTHERSHSGERPYLCNQCGRRFFKHQHLRLHQVVHTGEKPFSCPVCGKGFTRQSSVVKHSGMHAAQKPFVCKDCGKSYCQYASLIVHQRVHSGEKPFICKHCDKAFACKATMLKHEMAHLE